MRAASAIRLIGISGNFRPPSQTNKRARPTHWHRGGTESKCANSSSVIWLMSGSVLVPHSHETRDAVSQLIVALDTWVDGMRGRVITIGADGRPTNAYRDMPVLGFSSHGHAP
jgi:hypothetical protein